MTRLRLKRPPLFMELMSLPTQNYWITFTYVTAKDPKTHLYFSFPQFDVEPYFPRVNRFFDFCIDNMRQFSFIDFEIIKYKNQIQRYQVDIEKEFTIH
tara:strand:+ start:248 stop:541 length:294 start_codon:yes stop_codon:yes gene_type:complete